MENQRTALKMRRPNVGQRKLRAFIRIGNVVSRTYGQEPARFFFCFRVNECLQTDIFALLSDRKYLGTNGDI
jgi:hypothetical protein